MDNKTIGAGVIGLVIGAVVGLVGSDSGPNLEDIRGAIADGIEPATEGSAAAAEQVGSVGEAVTALDDRLAAIESQISEAPADPPGLAAVTDEVASLSEDVQALRTAVAEGLGASADAQEGLQSSLSALSEGLGGLAGALNGMAGGPLGELAGTASGEAAAPPAQPGAAPARSPSQTAAAVTAAGDTEGLGAGETASFAEGAVRVFVSRVDPDAGTARLSVNGEMTELGVGQTTETGDCMIALDSIAGRSAIVSAACGGSLPDPEGTGMGETAILGDGAARVFVSGISADGSAARIAVNGISPVSVALGESVETADGCSVTVEGIDRGHVTLAYGC